MQKDTQKKILKALLYPHFVILCLLFVISVPLVVYSLIYLDTAAPVSIISYVISAYTLTVWCLRIPDLIKSAKRIKNENKYLKLYFSDAELRVKISLYLSLILNIAYAFLQLGLGIYHGSFWFYSLSLYYISLSVMRFFILKGARRGAEDGIISQLKRYRACGIIFLIMNMAISLMIFFMVYFGRTFRHHEITTIALAAYTFTALTLAIIGVIRYRRDENPVYSAARAISLASAFVSMLTLEATMLTAFGAEGGEKMNRIFLSVSGGVISALILAMAVYMIVKAQRRLRKFKEKD